MGAAGHGASHLNHLVSLAAADRIRLAGVCDVRPVPRSDGVPAFTDHRRLLADVAPQVLVICTPPHTHLPIALDAVAAGCDLLLEKPPVLSLAEHAELARALADSGRVCQVGFQALGSPALAQLIDAIASGRLGTVTSVAGVGAWWRPDAYFTRAPWAARRVLDGRPVLDGAIANPFAHALMDCLVIATAAGAGWPEAFAVERYRVLDQEVEDTACLRLRLARGLDVTLAVSLRSDTFIPGDITVTGTGGEAFLEYPTDRLRMPGQSRPVHVPGRIDLLENLLDYRAARGGTGCGGAVGVDDVSGGDAAGDDAARRDTRAVGSVAGGARLLVPLAATAAFTAVVDALAGGPPPDRIAPAHLALHDGETAISGIATTVRRAGEQRAMFAELGVPWATSAWRSTVSTLEGTDAKAEPG